jgi:hypothetical protein
LRSGLVDLKLDTDEAQLLRQVLTDYAADLRMEIADTDQADLRATLKRNEAMLERIIGELGNLLDAQA